MINPLGRAAALAAAATILTPPGLAAPPASSPTASELFATLPERYNTVDDMALAPNGEIILAVPNFNNEEMIKAGLIKTDAPALIAAVDAKGRSRDWYRFKPQDLHPVTGKVGPMGVEFGPDGHLYFIDRQIAYDRNHATRIARIIVEGGQPVRMEVLVEGSIGANDLMWRGDTLFVTETVAVNPARKGEPTISGVYAFPRAELDRGGIRLRPYRSASDHDPHQIVTFRSSGSMGSGADGIAFDADGNLYTAVIEDGAIYRTELDAAGRVGSTKLWVTDLGIVSADGLTFDPARRLFYLADFLGNAVHAIAMDGRVTTLHRNGDTDSAGGLLDQPCATLVVGDRLVVSNMDYAGANPGLSVNTRVDRTHALSHIRLSPARGAGAGVMEDHFR